MNRGKQTWSVVNRSKFGDTLSAMTLTSVFMFRLPRHQHATPVLVVVAVPDDGVLPPRDEVERPNPAEEDPLADALATQTLCHVLDRAVVVALAEQTFDRKSVV